MFESCMVENPEDRFSRDDALFFLIKLTFEPPRDKTNKMAYVPSEDSDQPGLPPTLIRVFAVRSMGSRGPRVS